MSKISADLQFYSPSYNFTEINQDLYYLLSNSMEDFILREIDRLGEMLLIIARKLGLQEDVMPDYSLLDVKDEFDKAVCPINLDALLEQENPVWYLVETEKISDHGLETFIEILFHSDLDEDRKAAILHDALAYLDGKGFFSFKLYALFPLIDEIVPGNIAGHLSYSG